MVRQFRLVDGLYVRHAGHGGDSRLRPRYGHILAYLYVVPQVQTVPAAPLGKTAPVAENAANLGRTQLLRYLIQPRVARLHLPARECTDTERSGIVGQLYPDPSADYVIIVRHRYVRNVPFGSFGQHRFLRTGPHSRSSQ